MQLLQRTAALPYITATHDRENPRSGAVMQRIGMHYCYTYQEQWQPKDKTVYFRMYQENLDGQEERVYKKYWEQYPVHFVESLSESPKAESGKEKDAGSR